MGIISYAQNFEDVMLWRALGHIENGFYVDVGANHPVRHSVTKAFYEHGWTGINIEPLDEMFNNLNDDRPKDINAKVVISERTGDSVSFFHIDLEDGGLSTTDENLARNYTVGGFKVKRLEIPSYGLTDLIDEKLPRIEPRPTDIHFLKVDTEGTEGQVLASLDFSRYRPWIILVEATVPLSQTENHEHWENILLNNNYKHVYSDGLNRYYIDIARPELEDSFKYPPNVFDDFQSYSEFFATEETARITAENHVNYHRALELDSQNLQNIVALETANNQLETANNQLETANNQLDNANRQIEAILTSTSWRITSPLRAIRRAPTNARKRGIGIIRTTAIYIAGKPALKRQLIPIINRFPVLKRRILNSLVDQGQMVAESETKVRLAPETLSPFALEIYQKLKSTEL